MPAHIGGLSRAVGKVINRPEKRAIVEPGGILLVTIGLNEADAKAQIEHLYTRSGSLTLLISADQTALSAYGDEVWVYGPLGFSGFLALIRRISWCHFEAVYQPAPKALPWLRFLIWPRPDWKIQEIGG